MWLVLAIGCSTWISLAEQDARLADLGFVDVDGDGHADVTLTEDGGTTTPVSQGPLDWDDPDIVVERIEEGLHSKGGGMNVDLGRDVDGTLSRMVYCEAPGPEGEGEVNRIDDPEIAYAYDQSEPYDTPVRGGTYPNGCPALLPWSPDYRSDSGEVWYNLGMVTGEVFDCWAIEKYGTDRDQGTLRLRVVLSSRTIEESDLRSLNFDSAMQKVAETFAAVGITLDRSLETIDDGCANGTLSSYDAAAAMTACAVDVGQRELTLFLVDDLDGSILEPGEHAGFGLAPGVPFLGDGAMGAAFVPLTALQTEGDVGFAGDVAHTMGHFLGLWELWEYDENRGDPLSDTPDCTASVADDYTACPTSTHGNVMFPEPTPGSGMSFTEDQGWVMRRAALVR